jgi:hypothetical protein
MFPRVKPHCRTLVALQKPSHTAELQAREPPPLLLLLAPKNRKPDMVSSGALGGLPNYGVQCTTRRVAQPKAIPNVLCVDVALFACGRVLVACGCCRPEEDEDFYYGDGDGACTPSATHCILYFQGLARVTHTSCHWLSVCMELVVCHPSKLQWHGVT